MSDLAAQMLEMGRAARDAARPLARAPADQRSAAIRAGADALLARADQVLTANARDLDAAAARHAPATLVERRRLDPGRLETIAGAMRAVADQPDPL
ncbi:MAG: gamma-glutamyl-phosphate reductase, partial [Brevundimonas sp.]